MKVCYKVKIIGKVHGVSFRVYTRKMAQFFNINGWVRNDHDGSVEAFFQGDETAVLRMIEWCYIGSPYSKVKNVDIAQQDYEEEYSDFQVRY